MKWSTDFNSTLTARGLKLMNMSDYHSISTINQSMTVHFDGQWSINDRHKTVLKSLQQAIKIGYSGVVNAIGRNGNVLILPSSLWLRFRFRFWFSLGRKRLRKRFHRLWKPAFRKLGWWKVKRINWQGVLTRERFYSIRALTNNL